MPLLAGLFLVLACAAPADPYYNTTPHGFVTANCTGGVTDIYVVNAEWLCVVNDYMSNYWADIVAADTAAFGGGITNRYAQSYSNYLAGRIYNYDYWRDVQELHDWWAPEIRPGYDVPLNTAAYYRVTSPDDPAYAAGQSPTEVGRYINSVEQWRDPQSDVLIGGEVHCVNFSWIHLPQALSNGCRYAVSLGNGRSGNILYDEARTISRAIHANQVGYLDWAPEKYAYIGAWGGSYGPIEMPGVTNRQFSLVDSNGVPVFGGPVTLRYDPSLHDPVVFVDGQPATDATSYWHRAITLPAEGVATTVTVTMVTAMGVTNETVTRIYTWDSSATQEASVEGSVYPQNNYTSSTAEIEVRGYPTTEPIGEYVYELDFSDYRGTGTCHIAVPGVGRSWPFEIGPDVYGEPFYKLMKGLYQHRSGFEVKTNRLAWARPAAHTNIYRSHCTEVDLGWHSARAVDGSGSIGYFQQAKAEMWNLRHICGSESNFATFFRYPRSNPKWAERLDKYHRIPDCYGGWYDAADYDNRPQHFHVIYDLVSAYLMASNALVDGICNMDESGNGIPDILDECVWGLRIYRKSQREDGGVSVRFESYGHPQGYGTNDPMPYFASYPDRLSTVRYAAAAALLSWAIRPFDGAKADEFLHSASNAYGFAQNPENRVRNISYWFDSWPYRPDITRVFHDRMPEMLQFRETPDATSVFLEYARQLKWSPGSGRLYTVREYRYDEPEDFYPPTAYNTGPYVWHAPFFLYLASGDETYAGIVNAIKRRHHFFRTDDELGANFLLCFADPPAIDAELKSECWNSLIGRANGFLAMENRPYRQVPAQPEHWGASTPQRYSRTLLQAYALTGETNYLAKAILANDFALGCRPMGLVFTTGVGWSYITRLLNYYNETAGYDDPPPGIPTFAPTGWPDFNWRVRGYCLRYSRGFSRLFSGNKDVRTYPLPPPFDEAGEHAGRHVPAWRGAQVYQGNAALWEYTVDTTISPQLACFAPLVREGWEPGDGLTNMTPKAKSELYGYYFMP